MIWHRLNYNNYFHNKSPVQICTHESFINDEMNLYREISASQYIMFLTVALEGLETILFPQDMIQDIYKLHWNIINKLTGVT